MSVMSGTRRTGSKGDKYKKMSILSGSSFVRQHIPQTKSFNRASLLSMLNQYKSVYVKPRKGSFGKGVMKAYKANNVYVSHVGTTVKRHSTFDQLYSYLSAKTSGSGYIIQRTINSIKYNGRIVDFRVVVQLNSRGQAEVTGIAGRVSQGKRVVSNGGGGGEVGSLGSFFQGRQYYYVKNKLETLALSVMRQVRRNYPRQTEIGVDIAVDRNLNVWIIEHNYTPDHRMFANFGNGTLLRIIRYGAIYGKRYRL